MKMAFNASQAISEQLLMQCCDRNDVVRASCQHGEISLEQYLKQQAETVLHNRGITPLRDPEDFYLQAARLAGSRLGSIAEASVLKALQSGVICTADHHGGVYNAQTFQGDLLYTFLLRRLQYYEPYLPILGTAQVELGSTTYARGISLYNIKEQKRLLPFFSKKDTAKIALRTEAIHSDIVHRFRNRSVEKEKDPLTHRILEEICTNIYERQDVLACQNFAEQTTSIGVYLSAQLFSGREKPVLVYLEVEEVVRPLLVAELRERGSLFRELLEQKAHRESLSQFITSDGVPLAGQLFGCADDRGKKVYLKLDADGSLIGFSSHDRRMCFSADPDALSDLLEEKILFPGLYAVAFLLAFERGITLMGGMFQASYLPEWQRCTVNLLQQLGMKDVANRFCRYDCTGYVCGPMFALYGGKDFATPAGPIEFWQFRPSLEHLEELLGNTTLRDGHRIGLAEMYPDLLRHKERSPDWYRIIAEEVYQAYQGNILL